MVREQERGVKLWDQLPDGFHVWFEPVRGSCPRCTKSLLQRTKNLTCSKSTSLELVHQALQKIAGFTGPVQLACEQEISELLQKLDPKSTVLVTGSIYLVAGTFPIETQKLN